MVLEDWEKSSKEDFLAYPSDADMNKNMRGSIVEFKFHFDGIDVHAMKWLDNRGLTIASTFESAVPVSNV